MLPVTFAKLAFSITTITAISRNTRGPLGRAFSVRRRLSKAMLLPLPRQAAADMSLAYHLALAVCRKHQGNAHLLNELIRALCLTYYLQAASFGDVPLDLYRRGEAALEQAGARAIRDGVWGIGAEEASTLEEVLLIHDQQLACAAMWNITDAHDRLAWFIQSDRQSPIPAVTGRDVSEDDAGYDGCAMPRNLR